MPDTAAAANDPNAPVGPFTSDATDSASSSATTDTASTPPASTAAGPTSSDTSSEIPEHTVADMQSPPQPADAQARGWGRKVMGSILGALGGTQEVQYSRDPDSGKLIATHVKEGPGQQWKRIIAGALTGVAAGGSVAPGPGQKTRAFAAGTGASMARNKQQDNEKLERANEDYEFQQKAMVRKAQTALLNQQLTESSFNLGRAKTNAVFEDQGRENEFMRSIAQGGEGSRDLGVVSKPADGDYWHSLLEMNHGDPTLLKQQASGNIIGVPHVSKDGQMDGMHYAVVTPEWKNSKLDQDETFYKLTPPTSPGKKPTVDASTVKAGTMTNGDFWTNRMAAEKEILDWYNKDSEDKLRQSEIHKNAAEAGKANAEATLAGQQSQMLSGAQMDETAKMLVEGGEDPSQLSKRQKEYQPTINAANAYSMKTYGVPWDPAQASIDYSFAKNPATQNTLKYLNSLTGADGKSGNLGEIVNLSNKISRTEFPAINNAEAWAKINTGDPKMAGYQAAVTEVADQIAKIMQGGGTNSGTSDAKLKQAQEILDKKFTKDQIVEVANTLRPLLANRKVNLIGDNRYLKRQFLQPPQNATDEVLVGGHVVGHMVQPAGGGPKIYVSISGAQ